MIGIGFSCRLILGLPVITYVRFAIRLLGCVMYFGYHQRDSRLATLAPCRNMPYARPRHPCRRKTY